MRLKIYLLISIICSTSMGTNFHYIHAAQDAAEDKERHLPTTTNQHLTQSRHSGLMSNIALTPGKEKSKIAAFLENKGVGLTTTSKEEGQQIVRAAPTLIQEKPEDQEKRYPEREKKKKKKSSRVKALPEVDRISITAKKSPYTQEPFLPKEQNKQE